LGSDIGNVLLNQEFEIGNLWKELVLALEHASKDKVDNQPVLFPFVARDSSRDGDGMPINPAIGLA
jgi:hypothetical protein